MKTFRTFYEQSVMIPSSVRNQERLDKESSRIARRQRDLQKRQVKTQIASLRNELSTLNSNY